MINENCPLCGSQNHKVIYDVTNPKAHADIGLPGIIKICSDCQLIFKTFENKAENLYNDNYAESFMNSKEYSGSHAVEFYKNIISDSFKRVKKNDTKPPLLDIGSGIGIMLDASKETGYDPIGVELSSKLADIALKKGHTIINKNISEFTFDKKYDTITMMDIIEHLEDPKNILMTLKPLLSAKGELIVYTPNHNSLIVKVAGLFYRLGIKSPVENIFACTHTCFFTTKTLHRALIYAGYKIREVRHFNYDTSRPGQKVSLIAKIGVSALERIGRIIGFKPFRVVMFAQPQLQKS
ncbi:MAG: class I SAM-dependent methyltransferase [Chitinophagaceae bacterium]